MIVTAALFVQGRTYFTIAVESAGPVASQISQGAGGLNVVGATALAQAINPTLPVNGNWLVTGVNTWTTIDGQNIVWGNNIVWGSNIVWGNSITTSCNVLWGDVYLLP